MRRAELIVPFVFLPFLHVGCDPSPIYTENGRRTAAGRVSDRAAWRAYGELKNPQGAVDGDINTAAVAAAGSRMPSLTIDLGKACCFNMVVVDHGRREHGFARRVAVLISADGRRYRQWYVGPGTRRVTIFSLVQPALARYVKLQVVERGAEPWSVAEVHFQ